MMTLVLLSHQGTLGTDEIFIHTLAVQTVAADLLAIATDAQEAFTTAWNAHSVAQAGRWATTTTWRSVTAAEVLPPFDGPLSAGATSELPTPKSGTGTPMANQIAVAISLKGGVYPNGTPIRGRFYLPTPGVAMITTAGVIAPATASLVIEWIQDYFDELIARGLTPQVWSRKNMSSSPVTELRIGSVPDTMRSRRNQRAETYVTPV